MKQQITCSVIKDIKEHIRSKKNLLYSITLFLICIMVLSATKILPILIEVLKNNKQILMPINDSSATALIALFSDSLKANMGILSSDIVIIYGIVVVLSCYNLISKEISTRKWIFTRNAGYDAFTLILSKGLVYGIGVAFPSVLFYNAYYVVGSIFLIVDYSASAAFINSLILGFAMYSIVYITIILSTVYKQPVMSAATMILFIGVAPDIFALFFFGKLLPTHILTYLYQSKENCLDLLVPLISTVIIITVLTIIAAKKSSNIELY